MIPENIKQLLMSPDKEDVVLGLIIARKKRIPIKELDKFADELIENHQDYWYKVAGGVFSDYFEDKPKGTHNIYYRWRKHE